MNKTATLHNKLSLVKNGHDFIELNIQLIKSAKSSILLHTYIFEDDEVTKYIIEELLTSASRGVDIYIIVDAVGSSKLTDKTIQLLVNSGINFSIFKPIIKYRNIGRRLHQKVLLIDMEKCLIGGINISKVYNSPEYGTPWLDFSCLLEGEEIYQLFQKIAPIYEKQFSSFTTSAFSLTTNSDFKHYQICKTKTIVNDWFTRKHEIYDSYIEAINSASKSIYILATYFLPGKKLLNSLKHAKQRGVSVHLYFGTTTDQNLAAVASEYFYNWYLQTGINIYEWDKSIIHGKIAVIDSSWVSIGSYNHNFLSRYGNSEINLEVDNESFGAIVQSEFCEIQRNSTKIEILDYQHRVKVHQKIVLILTFWLLNLLTFLSLLTIYKQEDIKK
jgi:cardiolipin synthase